MNTTTATYKVLKLLNGEEHVLTIADASEGLSRYYEHVRREITRVDAPKYRKSLDEIENEEVYDDLLAELETEDTIH
jgi:hypothetical protein